MHLSDGSGMSREVHVPFCERLQGRFLRSTHQLGNLAVFMNREDISLSDFLYLPKAAGKYGLNG